MSLNASLSDNLDQIDLEFVEREATLQLLLKLSIQLYPAGLSLSNTVPIIEIFDIERARSTVQDCVHKANLQSESGHRPDYVAVDETVVQLNNDQYWLHVAVDPVTNEVLYRTLEPTRTNDISRSFFTELHENTTSMMRCFSSIIHPH